jgi:glycine oxidase
VAVAGGGAIGLAVAWRAAQRGLRVTVLERDAPGSGASSVAAGMLAPVTEASPLERPLLELGLASAAAYPAFAAELRDASGIDPGYIECGSLLVARDTDEAEALERELEVRETLGLEVGRLRPSQARRREPALAPSIRLALEIPSDHAIDPRALTAALAEACRRRGVELRAGAEVGAIEVGSDRVVGARLANGELVPAGQVVVAAGAWSGAIGGIPDPARVAVRPVKGQILRLHDPAGPGLLNGVLRMGGGYIVPRGDGRYVLGATMEERGFDTTVTAGAAFELLREAVELVPGIGELVLDELSAGLRPTTADNLPVLGPGALGGLHWATGHYRNGILLTPVTAEIVAGALAGVPAEIAG